MTALAEQLIAADEAERVELLQQRAAPFGVTLAYALKDACYAAWNSDPTQAVGAAAALAALAHYDPSPETAALAAWAAGIAALATGRMEDAISQLDEAAARFTALGSLHTAAATQVPKLIALAMLGLYDEAETCGLAARDLFLAHSDDLSAGKIEQNLGNIAFRRDRYAEAERYYRLAYGRFLPSNDATLLSRVENGLADVLTWRQQFAAARKLYEQALRRAEAADLPVVQAEVECNLGNLALFQGRYDQALDYLERSRRRYAALEMPHESAYAEQELAEAYLELNLIPEAAAIYARVTPVFAGLGMQAEHAWALAHHGLTALLLDQRDTARQEFAAARRLFDDEGNSVSAALVTLFEAQLLFREREYKAAAAAAGRAETTFAAGGNRARMLQARWLRGEVLRVIGRLDEARIALEAALDAAERAVLPQIAQRCQTSLGLLAATAGDTAAATARLTRAVTMIEELRAPLPAEDFRTAFVADKLAPYTELTRLCLDAGEVTEALGYVERARSRALVEMLGGAAPILARPRDQFEVDLLARLNELREELNWCYSRLNRALESEGRGASALDELQAAAQEREAAILDLTRQLQQRGGQSLAQVDHLDLARLQASLGTDTALVEYYSLDGELLAFVITGDSVDVIRDLASEAEVEAQIDQLRFQTDAVRRGIGQRINHMPQLLRRSQHYLARLYDALLRPIESLIGERRLVVAPHRSLHYVPFRALFDGAHYLIESREVCTTPSAAVLQHCLMRPAATSRRALLMGVPDARAPRVRDEILALAPLWPDRVALLDDQATAESLRRHAPDAGILHLACHGQFRPDSPLFSSLRLADGWFTARDAYSLELSCDLVVLSACETGVNAVAPGDELIGLTRGFFAAGAPSLVVSLWTVDDTTTADLMAIFYRELRAGARPSAALRQAQCSLLQKHPHPFFWAPFVLMGRW